MAPPIAPGRARRTRSLRSTLPNFQCDVPDTAVVNVSAACTQALVVAGGTPRLSMTDEEMTPYAMPMAPSTICAAKPTATNNSRSSHIALVTPLALLHARPQLRMAQAQVSPCCDQFAKARFLPGCRQRAAAELPRWRGGGTRGGPRRCLPDRGTDRARGVRASA